MITAKEYEIMKGQIQEPLLAALERLESRVDALERELAAKPAPAPKAKAKAKAA